jgi:hypothetical protein
MTKHEHQAVHAFCKGYLAAKPDCSCAELLDAAEVHLLRVRFPPFVMSVSFQGPALLVAP